MTHKEMHKLMDGILKEVIVTRDSGQKEYAQDKDEVFANFIRSGNQVDISCSFRRDNSVSCSKILIFATPSASNIPI